MHKLKVLHIVQLIVLTSIAIAPRAVSAQEVSLADNNPQVPPTKLSLSPKAAPEPALRYLLLPDLIDRLPGNAAVHYGKIKSEQNHFFTSPEIAKIIASAQEVPLAQLKADHAYDQLVNLGPIFSNMQRGARSAMADWQLPLREVHFTNLLLPEVQESRQFIRILYGRARIQIARGDFEGAIETMQTGIAMGKHIAEGPTLINSLVGYNAIDTMLGAAHEMIAQPDAPNLYWALADLPSPLIDFRKGLSGERYMLYFTEKGWLHPEQLQGDEHFWGRELDRLWSYLFDDRARNPRDNALRLYVIKGYPLAKQRLAARGFKSDEIEAMPVAKVIMLDALHQYNCNVDAMITRASQALAEPSRLSELRMENATSFPESLPIGERLGVATLHSIVQYTLLTERHRAALQVVEALRMTAADTGKLPERLQDVTSVNIPIDPSTGQVFDYQRSADTAILSSGKLIPELKLELSLRPASK